MDATDTAANACAFCKQNKRKCNKALPHCSTCSRLRRTCNYAIASTKASPEEEIALLRSRVEELETLVVRSTVPHSRSPSFTSSWTLENQSPSHSGTISSFFFLDERYFTHLQYRIPPVSLPVPDDLRHILKDEISQPGGVEQLVSRFFDTFHAWMPIISKTRMKRVLDRRVNNMQAGAAFFLCCMKLLLQPPHDDIRQNDTPIYQQLKAISVQLESAGLPSLMVIQGGILISIFELGHGNYPAAYATVAHSARQAISIGLHNREAPQFLQPWADWEEEIRVWWSIVMLDRHVTVGREFRPLCTEDPKKHTPLPTDSEAWDQGAMIAPERLYVSSPATSKTSSFARLAQAYNLLGRVIRHCDDSEQDLAFILNEMSTLHQAISALLELVRNEGCYVATAVCSSALMKLHKHFLYNSFHSYRQEFVSKADSELALRIRDYTEASLNIMRDTSLKVVELSENIERRKMVSGLESMSPLVLHCLYRAAYWLSYLASTDREETFIIGRSILDRVLRVLSSRWKVAGIYMELLQTVDREKSRDW